MAVIDGDRWRVLEPLLDEALDLSAEERVTWLGALRERSPDLAAELTELLSGEVTAERRGFLAEPLSLSLEGVQLGAYTLERPLGRGGMGSVWLARRTDGRFEGRAAVKFLDLGALSETAQERFRREGWLLARLTHPGIARLLDAGVSASNQPYLVLEYVEGQRIDDYADARRLPPAERIRLVLQVLAAVGHAHANLIVHRDLKPSNILVTADGTAKLLDFGIAKLLAGEGGEERTALTDAGSRVLTPQYAAPEQLRGGAITAATDVYASGVLLYALLTGRHPYDLADRSPGEVERIVCEEEPARPSAAFEGGARDGAERVARARARGNTPERLRRQLRGDLDVIVTKALRKEPERRYESAAALADDLRRALDGRPVLARPDSRVYRARKFVGRHGGAIAVGVVGVALLAGAALRELSLREQAEAEARKAKAVEQYLVSVFDVNDPYAAKPQKGEEVTARALLDRGVARVDSLSGQPDVQAELRSVLGRVYATLGLYDRATPLLRRGLQQQRALHGARHPAVASAMDQLGYALAQQDQLDEAEPLLREALAQRRALLGDRDTATAASLDHLATLLQTRDDFAAAEPLFREALAIRRAALGRDDEAVATSLNDLAVLLFQKGDYERAEPLYREALAIDVRTLGENHPLTAQVVHNLAQLQQLRGKLEEAESLFRRALAAKRKSLGNVHPSVTVNLNNLANLLTLRPGKLDEAEALAREAVALDRQIFGERHNYYAESVQNLALILRQKGDFDEAERLHRQTLEIYRSLYGAEHSRVAASLSYIATARYMKGDLAAAIPLYREALTLYGHTVGEKHLLHTSVVLALARALRERGKVVEAESLFRVAVGRLDSASQSHRILLIPAQVGLGQTLVDERRPAEALPLLEGALRMAVARWGADNYRTADARLALGECLLASGQAARAEPLLRDAYAVLEKNRRGQPRLFARAGAALARASNALGRPAAAGGSAAEPRRASGGG